MMINSKTLVSITEANQAEQMQVTEDEDIMRISARLIQQNQEAYDKLAK